MTYDKATYTVTFPANNFETPSYYELFAHEAATEHVTVETEVNAEANQLEITVHGDGNVIPVWEAQFVASVPVEMELTCDVDIGGGVR